MKGNKHSTKETQPDQGIFRGNVYLQNAAIEVKKTQQPNHKLSKFFSLKCTKQSHNKKKIALQSLKRNLNSKHVGKHGKSKIRDLYILNNKLQF